MSYCDFKFFKVFYYGRTNGRTRVFFSSWLPWDKQTNWVTSSLLELLIAAKNSVLIKMVECYFHSYKRLHIISFLFFFYGSYLKFFKVSNLWTFGNVNVISNNILKKKKLVLRIFSNKTKMRSSCLVSDYFLFVY